MKWCAVLWHLCPAAGEQTDVLSMVVQAEHAYTSVIATSRSMDPVWSASRKFFDEIDRRAINTPEAEALQNKARDHRDRVWRLLEDSCYKDCTLKWQKHIAEFFDTLLKTWSPGNGGV
jgi:hypothetical protein